MISKFIYILLFLSAFVLSASVNINNATLEELKTLPRIGEKKAKAIIEYRKENGDFKSKSEIVNVKGIGESTALKLKDLISLTNKENDNTKSTMSFSEDEIDNLVIKVSDDPKGKININTASEEELLMLPGIGKVKVERIVEYRNHKYFHSLEELKNIKGIGKKSFEKISDFITIKVNVNCIASKKLIRLKKMNADFIKELLFYKKKEIRISNSFLRKRFEKFNISKEDQKLFYLPKSEDK